MANKLRNSGEEPKHAYTPDDYDGSEKSENFHSQVKMDSLAINKV